MKDNKTTTISVRSLLGRTQVEIDHSMTFGEVVQLLADKFRVPHSDQAWLVQAEILGMITSESESDDDDANVAVSVDPATIEQEGGGKRARADQSDKGVEGFKMTPKFTSKTHRLRLIDEDLRNNIHRVSSSVAECSVISAIVTKMKDMLKEARSSPRQCFVHLFENVDTSRLSSFVADLAGHNNPSFRIKQLQDVALPHLEADLGEVEIILLTTQKIVKRSIEAMIVEFYGNESGEISWTQMYQAITELHVKRDTNKERRSRGVGTGTPPPSGGGGNDMDIDSYGDDDDDKPSKKPSKSSKEDDDGSDELLPELENMEIASAAAAAKKPRGRPPKN